MLNFCIIFNNVVYHSVLLKKCLYICLNCVSVYTIFRIISSFTLIKLKHYIILLSVEEQFSKNWIFKLGDKIKSFCFHELIFWHYYYQIFKNLMLYYFFRQPRTCHVSLVFLGASLLVPGISADTGRFQITCFQFFCHI